MSMNSQPQDARSAVLFDKLNKIETLAMGQVELRHILMDILQVNEHHTWDMLLPEQRSLLAQVEVLLEINIPPTVTMRKLASERGMFKNFIEKRVSLRSAVLALARTFNCITHPEFDVHKDTAPTDFVAEPSQNPIRVHRSVTVKFFSVHVDVLEQVRVFWQVTARLRQSSEIYDTVPDEFLDTFPLRLSEAARKALLEATLSRTPSRSSSSGSRHSNSAQNGVSGKPDEFRSASVSPKTKGKPSQNTPLAHAPSSGLGRGRAVSVVRHLPVLRNWSLVDPGNVNRPSVTDHRASTVRPGFTRLAGRRKLFTKAKIEK